MAQEIERKFLVKNDSYKELASTKTRIIQGYLSSVPERTVRIRIIGNNGFITVKGKSNETGVSRYEWEKEIPINEAKELLNLCETGIVDKVRHNIKVGEHIFEVDEFYGDNNGLVVAEVELSAENESFEKPEWIYKEVTGENKYYNSQLIKMPYSMW